MRTFTPRRRVRDFASSVFFVVAGPASFVADADTAIRLAGASCVFIGVQNILRLLRTVVEVSPGSVRYRPFFSWFEFDSATTVRDERIALLVGENRNLVLSRPGRRKLRISIKRYAPDVGQELARLIHEALDDNTADLEPS